MMKTFLGNISVQKKKIIPKSVWAWYLAVVCVIWGKGLGVTIKIFFFLSEIIEKVMQNNLTNEMLLTSKYI